MIIGSQLSAIWEQRIGPSGASLWRLDMNCIFSPPGARWAVLPAYHRRYKMIETLPFSDSRINA